MFEAAPVRRIDPCSLGKWLNTLTETDRINLGKWLSAEWVSNSDIRKQIMSETENKKPFSVDTIADHRQERCRCSRS